MGPLPPLRKDTHRPASAWDSFPQDCMLGLLRSHRSCRRTLRRENVESAGDPWPSDRSAAEAARRSFAAEAAAGDLMVVEDGRREKVAEIRW